MVNLYIVQTIPASIHPFPNSFPGPSFHSDFGNLSWIFQLTGFLISPLQPSVTAIFIVLHSSCSFFHHLAPSLLILNIPFGTDFPNFYCFASYVFIYYQRNPTVKKMPQTAVMTMLTPLLQSQFSLPVFPTLRSWIKRVLQMDNQGAVLLPAKSALWSIQHQLVLHLSVQPSS